MATHHNPIETVNAILFATDTIADAFELAAFAVLGVGWSRSPPPASRSGAAAPPPRVPGAAARSCSASSCSP
jgi:hypothetical protein